MQIRNTVQRQIVLNTVLKMRNHPTAESVYEEVIKEHPSISKATVYRNLNQLAQQKAILRVPIPNGADRFDYHTEQHYHLRCIKCGEVYDVQMPYQTQLIHQVEDSYGAEIIHHQILFEGICNKCKTTAK